MRYFAKMCSTQTKISNIIHVFTPHIHVHSFKDQTPIFLQLCRGDVVLCLSVENPGELIVKRVTAMEGDRMPDILQPINRYIRHSDSKTVSFCLLLKYKKF